MHPIGESCLRATDSRKRQFNAAQAGEQGVYPRLGIGKQHSRARSGRYDLSGPQAAGMPGCDMVGQPDQQAQDVARWVGPFCFRYFCGIEIQGRGLSKLIDRSEEHTSELQSLMRISYAVFCLKKKTTYNHIAKLMRCT